MLVRKGTELVRAAASVVVEATLWLVAQALFCGVGLALMAGGATHSAVARFVAIGIAVGIALAGLFALTQHRVGVFSALRRASVAIIGKDLLRRFGDAERLDRVIRALYRERRALLATFAFQLAALLAGALELWVALCLLGRPTSVRAVIVLGSVTTAVESGAFLVPAGIGAQEGSYVLLGAVIGLSPHVALALSLMVRARQVVLGVPALVSWAWAEGKSAGARSRAAVRRPEPTASSSP
jgi:putative membrane protein